MRGSTGILAAMLLGMAGAMNQHQPPPSFGGAGIRSGPDAYSSRTKRGGRMQQVGVKKPRNRKGKSR